MKAPYKPGFRITGKKGFHITFENGWTISVQIGPDDERCGNEGSSNAECAIWGPDGNMIELPTGDVVTNRSTPAEVLELINMAAKGGIA
jgi:hypothetical protein